jgi:putative Holliday junction resolvase
MCNFAIVMGRLLAIDFGRKRCGIAVTDSLRIVANPLETVDTSKLIAYVKDYLSKESVDTIVVGKPKNLNGNDSDSMRYLTPVINKLRKEIAPIPVEFYDERFTSVLAHRAMLDGGMSKMARRDKAVVDRISASIILNDYLNSNQNK